MQSRACPVRYHDVTFDADFLTATRPGGEQIRFSRLERALLSAFAARPGRLFSREQLLAAMSGEPEEASDRNVDFVINRLRKKLGDSARAPHFIATQYGEGYTWIAPAAADMRTGFLVVGPVRGLHEAPHRVKIEHAIGRLTAKIAERCAVGQEIAFLPQWSRGDVESAAFCFSVCADFIANRARPEGAFTLRDEKDARVVRVMRCQFGEGDLDPLLVWLARSLIGAIWRDLAVAPAAGLDPGGPPLEIRMHNAAMAVSPSVANGWGYMAERLADEETAAPGDPEIAVMRATHLYAQMLMNLDFGSDPERFHTAEGHIERLVLGALPAVRSNPIFRLAAAKLLFAIGKKHLRLVQTLVDESLAESAMFAAALCQQASINAYRGDLGEAIASCDQALTFCEPNSEFQIYLLVKKSTVLVAQGDWTAARAILHRILDIKPAARGQMEVFYLSPDDGPIEPEARIAMDRLSRPAATRLLWRHYHMHARHFGRPEQARNVMAGPAWHLVTRFGPSVLPSVVRRMGLTAQVKTAVGKAPAPSPLRQSAHGPWLS